MNTLSSLLKFIGNKINVVRATHAVTTTLSINEGTLNNTTYTITKAGYYPLAVAGWRVDNGSGSGGSYALASSMRLSEASNGTAKVNGIFRAVGGNVNNCTLNVDILWQKVGGG